ncbi:hypothetical protein HYR53_04310 [Candidatus Acetothermia bacterium]|nr:hypothetical protein [Candidatus Acetothermia bacterium]
MFIVVFFWLGVLAVWAWGWWLIIGKTGNSPAMMFLLLIPFVNIAVFFYFAFSTWPIEDDLTSANEEIHELNLKIRDLKSELLKANEKSS